MIDGGTALSLAALEHSYKWFEYHAKQRLEMFKFFVLIGAGLFSVAGFALQAQHKYLLATVGVLLTAISVLFWKIDGRSRELTGFGEAAIANYWREAGLKDAFCPALLAQAQQPGQMRYRRAFALAFLLSGLIGIGLAVVGLRL